VIVVAVWRLGRKALGDVPKGVIALGVASAVLAGADTTLALLAGGALGALLLGLARRDGRARAAALVPVLFLQGGAAAGPAAGASLPKLFLFFLKVGSVLYGSGYVLVAFLEDDLVERLGWLTREELLDAIALGQFTPGPVLSSATFVGFLVDGWAGAAVATVGIFLPAFLIVLAIAPLVPRLRDSVWAGRFLDAVSAAAVALMAVVAIDLGRTALEGTLPRVVFATALLALTRFRVPSAWVMLGGVAVSGAAMTLG